MKAIMFDLQIPKVILQKLKLKRYGMITYREDWPEPKIQHPNQLIIRPLLSGICASDMHQISLQISFYTSILANKQNPFPIGHEMVGIIEEVGHEVKGLKPGDRVTFNNVPHCAAYGFNLCPSCQKGNWEQCYCLVGIGDGTDKEKQYGGRNAFGGVGGGGFSEKLVCFAPQCYKIPENLPDEIAVLTEPLTVALHTIGRNFPPNNATVIVIGAGIIGLMVINAIRALGSKCRIICLSKYTFQSEIAKRLGADEIVSDRDSASIFKKIVALTGGNLFKETLGPQVNYGEGPDMIFDCVATEQSMDDAIRIVKNTGTIIVVGLGYTITKKIDWSVAVYKELKIIGSMMHGRMPDSSGNSSNGPDPFLKAIDILSKDPTRYKGLVTHFFPIEQYRRAFETTIHKGKYRAIKVVFDYRK